MRFDSLSVVLRYLIERGHMEQRANYEQGKRPTPPLARMMKRIVKGGKPEGNTVRRGKSFKVIKDVTVILSESKKHRLAVIATKVVALDDTPAGSKGNEEEAAERASVGRDEEGSPTKTRSRWMFANLRRDLEKKLLASLTKDLELFPTLGWNASKNT
ncbi:Uncharacterized protein Adt_12350 [Abeliophyllum distichum]|uniref:Uncharacterized protein n=1 Tax=Abeliophyllum distichum TaxID=126358 RepID=A0ABD1UQI0_9LAMI